MNDLKQRVDQEQDRGEPLGTSKLRSADLTVSFLKVGAGKQVSIPGHMCSACLLLHAALACVQQQCTWGAHSMAMGSFRTLGPHPSACATEADSI